MKTIGAKIWLKQLVQKAAGQTKDCKQRRKRKKSRLVSRVGMGC